MALLTTYAFVRLATMETTATLELTVEPYQM